MIRYAKILIVVLFASSTLSAAVPTTQCDLPKRELHFEIPERPLPLKAPLGDFPATHMAYLQVKGDREYLLEKDNARYSDLLPFMTATPTYTSMTKKQKDFLADFAHSIMRLVSHRPTQQGTHEVQFFAVSSEDAQKMALAVLEAFDNQTYRKCMDLQNNIETLTQEVRALEKRLPEVEKEVLKAKSNFDRARVQNERYLGDPELARKDVLEFDKMLESLDIEFAGVQARLEAIDAAKRGKVTEEIRSALSKMQIEQDIELTGLRAKQRKEEALRDKAKAYYEAYREHIATRDEIGDIHSNLPRRRAALKDAQDQWKERAGWLKPVTVIDNKVLIYTVKHPDTKSARQASNSAPSSPPATQPGK